MIRDAGEPQLAEAELGKILLLRPDHIGARITRASQALEAGRLDAAFPDIKAVIDHPGLAEYLRNEAVLLAKAHEPNRLALITTLGNRSRNYCHDGRVKEGRAIARLALDLAIASKMQVAESHYNLARAHAVSDQIVLTDVATAADHLYRSFVAHPYYKKRYAGDATFYAVRVQLDAILDSMPDPSAEHHRRLAAMSSPKGR
jgi:hypothetical protein